MKVKAHGRGGGMKGGGKRKGKRNANGKNEEITREQKAKRGRRRGGGKCANARGLLTESHHLVGVTTKGGNVLLHPLHPKALVLDAQAASGAELLRSEKEWGGT